MLSFRTIVALSTLVALAAGKSALTSDVGDWWASGTPGFNYDCSDKADGNYPHPTLCTHYVACVARSHAYEMVCALGHDGNPLHYVADSGPDPAKSRCDYPEVARCTIHPEPTTAEPVQPTTVAPENPTTEAGNKPTTRPPVTSPPPSDRTCNPNECWVDGHCQSYQVCEDGVLHPVTDCGDDLFFDDTIKQEYGGDCVNWDDLNEDLKKEYLADPECIGPCKWEAAGPCSSTYTFLEKFDFKKLSERKTHTYTCGKDIDGNQLIWNDAKVACDHRSNVPGC